MEEQKQPELELQDYIGRRIEVQGNLGTVKFAGPLVHEGKPENSENELWFGVEWDDVNRGKHNGTVKDHQYFTTTNNQNCGSLIKSSKGTFGRNVLDGILRKYFKDDIDEKIIEKITDKILVDSDLKEAEKVDDDELQKVENFDLTEEEWAEKKKSVQVEMDENAYFETGRKEKKMVQFYGFDRIWEKLNNMRFLKEMSLYQVDISDVGQPGYLGKLLPNLEVLSLERNMLYDWDQVFQIGIELTNLRELQIARNIMRKPSPIDDQKSIKSYNNNETLEVSPVGVFKKLKYLNFIEMGLSWKDISAILPAFPVLEDLILCLNDLTDTENINLREKDLQNLKFLNLESANLEEFDDNLKKFGNLPNLEKLIMNKNKLKSLGKFDNFKNVKLVSLEKNLIENPRIFTELSQFTSLEILNIKHNPMADIYGKSYVRQRAVAENPKIVFINGSDLKKYERKDCEIFYLRRTFDDFFKITESVYYDYDFDKFLAWAKDLHPRINYLLDVYGNPYEQQPKNPDNTEGEVQPKNVMIKVKIVIAAGPLLGKNPLNKKFPESTTVQTLKNVFSKLLQIPGDEQIIYYKINQNDPMEILDEDHKTLSHYGIKDDSEITVADK